MYCEERQGEQEEETCMDARKRKTKTSPGLEITFLDSEKMQKKKISPLLAIWSGVTV
jgi:hypothetical protein